MTSFFLFFTRKQYSKWAQINTGSSSPQRVNDKTRRNTTNTPVPGRPEDVVSENVGEQPKSQQKHHHRARHLPWRQLRQVLPAGPHLRAVGPLVYPLVDMVATAKQVREGEGTRGVSRGRTRLRVLKILLCSSSCDHGWIPGGAVKVRQSINQNRRKFTTN